MRFMQMVPRIVLFEVLAYRLPTPVIALTVDYYEKLWKCGHPSAPNDAEDRLNNV
jgi:hypothetical protein